MIEMKEALLCKESVNNEVQPPERFDSNEIKQKYLIIGLSKLGKKVIHDCQRCKNKKAIPFASVMGDLALERVTPYVRPFTYCDMDYFGPYQVEVGCQWENRLGVIFTCMISSIISHVLRNSTFIHH